MKSCFFSFLLFACLAASAQKLKRADRATLANIHAHLNRLQGSQSGGWSIDEGSAAAYITRQFEHDGLRPHGKNNSWMQQFEIDEGKTIESATCLVINGDSLRLLEDYTVAAFSASQELSSVVSAALAEKGVPWFKDFREVTDGVENPGTDQLAAMVREKAEHAASRGASALLIYNTPLSTAAFQKMDSSEPLSIPILLVGESAGKPYFSNESALLDIHLKVAIGSTTTRGANLIGYADNNADSTVLATAHLDDDTATAALLELARLTGRLKSQKNNYLFIIYSDEKDGTAGEQYYQQHPCVNPQKVCRRVRLDSAPATGEGELKALGMVKEGMDRIQHK